MKFCTECCVEKPKSSFYKEKLSKDGLRSKCSDCLRRRHIHRTYGLHPEGFDGMIWVQDNKCCNCERNFDNLQVVVDHDHETGIVRGLICSGCNTGLGQLGDNIEGLKRALRYLEMAPKSRI